MKKYNFFEKNKLFFALFFLCVLKYLLYGFKYYPVLDDFIQYKCYNLYESLSYVYFNIGTVATRPFASLLDPFFWGKTGFNASLALLTLMHFFSAVFFYKAANKLSVCLTPVFGIVYLLLPLGAESFYWISAATRIVCGLFFSSLGIYFLACFIKSKKRVFILPFWLFTFIAGGFYEAALAFGASLSVLIMFFYRKKIKDKWVFAVPPINCALLAGAYAALSNVGRMGSRAQGFTLKSVFTFEKVGSFFSQVGEIVKSGIFTLTKTAFLNGLAALNKSFFGIFVLLLILGASAWFFAGFCKKTKVRLSFLICAVIMFFAPLFVNLLSKEVWLTYRSFGFSIFAMALFCEFFASLFKSTGLLKVLCFSFSVLFSVALIGEYDAYKSVSENDVFLCSKIYDMLDSDVKNGKKEVVVITENEPFSLKTVYYKDHIKSVFYSDWALTGALRATGENIKIKKAVPLKNGEKINYENKQIIYIDKNLNLKGESADE